MTTPDLIGLFVGPLEDLGLSYMVTGAVAAVVYGEPRFTRDVDLVLELRGEDVQRLVDAFPSDEFYVPPTDTLYEEVARPRGGHFNVLHHDTGLRADVYLRKDDPLHLWGFEKRRRIDLEDRAFWVAPVEYVILRKLEYYEASGSDRHLRDVAAMLRVSGSSLEDSDLSSWIDRLGLADAWRTARSWEA